jgi:uncharacterized protein (TIGR04222 family)
MATELKPTEAAYLTGGPRNAVLAALVMLRCGSAVTAGQPGTIKRNGPMPSGADPVMRAIMASLGTPMGSRAIRRRISVDKALMALRKRLVAAKLLIPTWRRLLVPLVLLGLGGAMVVTQPWVAGGAGALALVSMRWPRCTRAGRRAVRELRQAYQVPDSDDDTDDEPLPAWDTGMVVAVHGELELPGVDAFARRARLRSGGVWPDGPSVGPNNNAGNYTAGAGF